MCASMYTDANCGHSCGGHNLPPSSAQRSTTYIHMSDMDMFFASYRRNKSPLCMKHTSTRECSGKEDVSIYFKIFVTSSDIRHALLGYVLEITGPSMTGPRTKNGSTFFYFLIFLSILITKGKPSVHYTHLSAWSTFSLSRFFFRKRYIAYPYAR